MIGRERMLFVEEHLLVKFFARPDARELELDVLAGLVATKPDQIGGQIDDLDRLAHVEDEHLAAQPKRTSLEHQLNGFRDGHEVAAHLRMSDQHGPASAYLAEERRHHRSSASQHISKAYRHEVAPVCHSGMLDHAFGEALGRAHDAGRSYGFVRRDQDEMLDASIDRRIHDVGGAVDVVCDCLDDVLFHERHVLVGRGMEDGIWTAIVEDGVHSVLIADVGDRGNDIQVWEAAEQLGLDVENRVLTVAEHDKARGFEPRELAAELAADGATGAGDEYRTALCQISDCGEIGLDRLAAEQILDLDVAQRRWGCAA